MLAVSFSQHLLAAKIIIYTRKLSALPSLNKKDKYLNVWVHDLSKLSKKQGIK